MTHQSTKLSSKNQLTLPVKVLRQLGWDTEERLSLVVQGDRLVIQKYHSVLSDVKDITQKYSLPAMSVEEAIDTAYRDKANERYEK